MVILNEPFLSLWKNKDPFLEVKKLYGIVYRKVKNRCTQRIQINNQSFYLKLHDGTTFREVLKNLIKGQMPVIGASHEWKAIHDLAANGVYTMDGVAYGDQGENPFSKTSFIITKDLNPAISVEEYIKENHGNIPFPQKRLIIKHIAASIRKMHTIGICHRDCYLAHFLIKLPWNGSNDTLRIHMIDLHRAQFRNPLSRHQRNKDLAALFYSARKNGFSYSDCALFLCNYFQKGFRSIWNEEKENFLAIEKKAKNIQLHTLKHRL